MPRARRQMPNFAAFDGALGNQVGPQARANRTYAPGAVTMAIANRRRSNMPRRTTSNLPAVSTGNRALRVGGGVASGGRTMRVASTRSIPGQLALSGGTGARRPRAGAGTTVSYRIGNRIVSTGS